MERGYDVGREAVKWVAIVTMTIDHVGATLYPQYEVLRIIGRIAFPLFGYLLVLGFESTRNVENYLIRLFLFALISQVPFYLAFGMEPFESLNIFFTLFAGLAFIYFYQKKNVILTIFPVLVSGFLNFDYGIYGIILIGCMYLIRKDMELGVFSLVLLNLISVIVWPIQFMSLLALPIILLYNRRSLEMPKEAKRKATYSPWKKYFFYAYYPLHLLALYFIRISI